jgi:hypothetical protein
MQEEFDAVKAICSQATYLYTSPAPYSVSTVTTPLPTVDGTVAPTPTAVCASTYVVQPGDLCNGIATAQSVSTFSIMNLNGIDLACSNLQAGANLCLDKPCVLYLVQPLDNWDTILSHLDSAVTLNQLVTWNPHLNYLGGNLQNIPFQLICVGYDNPSSFRLSSTVL